MIASHSRFCLMLSSKATKALLSKLLRKVLCACGSGSHSLSGFASFSPEKHSNKVACFRLIGVAGGGSSGGGSGGLGTKASQDMPRKCTFSLAALARKSLELETKWQGTRKTGVIITLAKPAHEGLLLACPPRLDFFTTRLPNKA